MNDMRHIGNYHVLSEIGAGSFGCVYLAQHAILTNRKVAIKLMHVIGPASPEEQEHFLQEARFLEMLKHPHILPILDVGIHEGRPYLVAEYAPGGSLRQRLKQQRILSQHTAATIISQIGKALHYAHQQNIIHRDIKPENILFASAGSALIADFGLATTLSTMSIKYVTSAGTPLYMSPEQFRGTVSKESDQYALACIAYELFTGHPVFTATDPVAIMYKHVNEEPVAPTQYNFMLSPHVERALLKALSKQRQDRYPHVQAFIEALTTSAPSEPQLPPFSESSIATTPRIQSYHASVESALQEQIEAPSLYPPSLYENANPQTPLPPSLASYRNTYPGNTFAVSSEAMSGGGYVFESGSPYMLSAEKNTPLPFAHSEIVSQPHLLPIERFHTTTTEAPYANKRKWLLTIAVIALLMLLISSSVWYGIAASASKTSNSSTNKSSGVGTNLNQPTKTQDTNNQHPNTGAARTGNSNQPTGTTSQNTNNNQPPTSSASAVIVITPARKDFKNIYTVTAVPGPPNAAQHQIAAHLLTSPQTQVQTVNATGQGTTAATAAQGSITVLNSSTLPFTFAAGVQIQTTNYSAGTITVSLDQGGTVPPADSTTTPATPGQVTVSAHTVDTGLIANIPALAINTAIGPNGDSYVNNAAFTGGQDPQTYAVLLQSDIDNAASPIISSLLPTAQAGVQSQIQTNQQLIQQIQCTSSAAPHDPAGSPVVSTTITVTVTCTGEVYAPQDAQNMALSWLQHDASANTSATYQLIGQATATITQTQLSNPQQGVITLAVQAESMGIFQFSNAKKQQLVQAIVGQSQQNAQVILSKQAGIAKAAITINNGGSVLPQNAQQILITIGN